MRDWPSNATESIVKKHWVRIIGISVVVMEVRADTQESAENKAIAGFGEWVDFPKIETRAEYIKELSEEDIKNGHGNNNIDNDNIESGS
jgi:hypothetical protein